MPQADAYALMVEGLPGEQFDSPSGVLQAIAADEEMISLSEIIRTGALGRVRLGMSSAAVWEILGSPEDTSTNREMPNWKYGFAQLTFREGHLTMICLSFHDTKKPRPPACFRWKGWAPTRATTLDDFRCRLLEMGAECSTDLTLTSGDQTCLAVGPTIRARFRSRGGTSSLDSLCITSSPLGG